MTEPAAASGPWWGDGDTYTLAIAIPIFVLGCCIHRKSIRAKGWESSDMIGGIMAGALTFGPFIMILADPLNKIFHILPLDRLHTVATEARITLWFASFLALVNTGIAFLRPKQL